MTCDDLNVPINFSVCPPRFPSSSASRNRQDSGKRIRVMSTANETPASTQKRVLHESGRCLQRQNRRWGLQRGGSKARTLVAGETTGLYEDGLNTHNSWVVSSGPSPPHLPVLGFPPPRVFGGWDCDTRRPAPRSFVSQPRSQERTLGSQTLTRSR